jgi:serine/threonine protein kinase
MNLRKFPKLIASGEDLKGFDFVVLDRLGNTMKDMIRRTKAKKFRIKTVIQIAIQVLDRLEDLHNLGYVHLDLKLDNLMTGSENVMMKKSSHIFLIDFGISKRFEDVKGNHIRMYKTSSFAGNALFASKNAWKQKPLTRRDDLISLFYILVFL